jgi:hypothetical protein
MSVPAQMTKKKNTAFCLYTNCTVGAVSITNTKSITNGRFAAVYTIKQILFRLFSFFIINWLNKMYRICFFRHRFLIAVFFGGEQVFGFYIFDLDENMLNYMKVDFFPVGIIKKGIQL